MEQTTWLVIGNCIDFGLLSTAVIAAIISYREYNSHKVKEDNKLLSQLNKRYVESDDVQTVVRYLRVNEPSNIAPTAYQIDLFLRFFEELGVYLKSGSLKRDDVVNYFGYYFFRFDNCKRGKVLKNKICNEDATLGYLKDFRILIEPYPTEWRDGEDGADDTEKE